MTAFSLVRQLIRKNPFQFQLMEVVVNDSVTREAISRAQERKFLQFVKEDPHFCRYYEGIYILFKTGLRISEFCGLTISDIDFKEHTINIDHQLQKKSKIGYYIQETKTTSGTRKISMTADVEECFRKIIEKRNPPKAEPMVDGKSGFLYFDKNGSICYSLHWEHYFQHIIQKYNNTYKVQMNVITPHVCRHTYCSNMAKSGMNPKALQYLMGHSDISVTLNTYTHAELAACMAKTAKEAKRVSPKATIEENEKYYMRVWLVRIGLGGKDGKDTRKVFLSRLKGHTAFRTEEDKEKWKERNSKKSTESAE